MFVDDKLISQLKNGVHSFAQSDANIKESLGEVIL